MAFDPTKPCRTRDGRDVRVLCVDAPSIYPIIGYVVTGNECAARMWTEYGMYRDDGNPSRYDLENIPEPVEECWVNVYWNGGSPSAGRVHLTRADADSWAEDDRFACVRVRKGDGL